MRGKLRALIATFLVNLLKNYNLLTNNPNMKKFLLLLAAFLGLGAASANAAMFTTSPAPLQETSQNIVITFNALESGVDGLKGLNTDLYAHLGVLTNKSPNDWAHVVTNWSTNNEANCLKRVSANTYQITISDLRTFFKVTDASETITSICIIARKADGSAQTSDQFIPVYPQGYYMDFTSSPGQTVIKASTSFTFTAQTTETGDLAIYVNGSKVKEAASVKSLSYTQTFSQAGQSWEVKAIGTQGSTKHEQTINVMYITPSPQRNYPGGKPIQGTVRNSDGTVTFCLAAPGKENVILVGSWDDYTPLSKNTMYYQDYNGYRYFWTTVSGLDNTSYYPYYYLVDGKYKVADPYAHLILDYISDKWLGDDGNDPYPDRPQYPYSKIDDTMMGVYKADLDDYNWQVTNFKIENPQALTIYELLFRDFTGTDKKADGTVRAAIEKIPYLKELGVTAVELMPIMEFDGNNSWGYNTNCYMAPDKSYGSPDDYKEFIDKCHKEGIAVILDIVFNHTPGLHPWYAMYDAGTSPFYNATAPHDYSVYEDIRQEYPLVEQHWKDVLTYWLTAYKVDGFRFDLVKGLGDSNSYGSGTEAYNQSRIDRMARLHAHMLSVNPNAIHINEHLASQQEETPMGNDGQLLWNNQSSTAISYVRGGTSASAFSVGNFQYFISEKCSRPEFSTVDYCESHDEQRMGYAVKSAGGNKNSNTTGETNYTNRLAAAGVQMLMMPGPKMIWMFGEYGDDQNTKTSSGGNNTDCKEVMWNFLQNTTDRKRGFRNQIHDAYQSVAWLRRSFPELFSKGTTYTLSNFGSSVTSIRSVVLRKGNREIVAMFNPHCKTAYTGKATTQYVNANNYSLVAASSSFTPTVTGSGTISVNSIPKNGFCVFMTKEMQSGVDDIITDTDDNSVRVYGAQGEIVIEGEYNIATVYNLAGQQINSLQVEAGVYLVNVDGKVTKVAVR